MKTSPTEAYLLTTTPIGAFVKWNLSTPNTPIVQNGRIVYSLNPTGSDNVPFAQVESALQSSFKAWEDLPDSNILFTRGANRTETGTGNDGIFQVYWTESTTVIDGQDITGALGVAFSRYGPSSGEMLDVTLVFNGKENQWSTDGNAGTYDIAEVATHEIGHALGIGHSPVGAATMFPRTGAGVTRGRSLARDDQTAAAVLYPASATTTGSIRGRVRDSAGAGILGAIVAATDKDGNVIATTLSKTDGAYAIQALPPGDYQVYAEPIDPTTQLGAYYSTDDISESLYDNAVTNFLATNDLNATVRAANESLLEITVTRGTPAFNPSLVGTPTGGFTNAGLIVNQGATFSVAVAGPGLPSSGTPLTVSGTGITNTSYQFGTLSNNFPAIVLNLQVAANAAPGARNLIITSGGQRSIVTGALEIVGTNTTQTLSVASAANFSNKVATESIAVLFGQDLATTTFRATTTPLPTTLGNVSVTLRDSLGKDWAAPLFFVGPRQINYQIPPGVATGAARITAQNGTTVLGIGSLTIETSAPGLFTFPATGNGPAAGSLIRAKTNNQQVNEAIAQFNTTTNTWETIPINWATASDRVFLVLYGTGLRFRTSLSAVTANLGGRNPRVAFAGAQGRLVGVDQINLELNRADVIGRGELDLFLLVDGKQTNSVKVRFQ